MPDSHPPDEDLDVTLRWPQGTPPEPQLRAAGEPAPEPAPEPRRSAPLRSAGLPGPVRVRPGGSALAELRAEVAELRAEVEALTAEVAALRDAQRA